MIKKFSALYFSLSGGSPIFPHANILESNVELVQQICRKSLSGQSTPSGMQTPSRKGSVEPTTQRTERTSASTSRGTTPSEKKTPFRL